MPKTLYKGNQVLKTMIVFYILNIISLLLTGAFGITNLVSLLQLFMVFLLFQSKEVMNYYFKYLKNVFLLLCVLGIINFILETIYTPEKLLLLKDITYNDNTYTFELYLPLCWSQMHWFIPGDTVFSGEHIRQCYFFIEPGMVPTFFVATIFIILNTPNEKSKWLKLTILTLGIFLTFSLGGVIILFSSLCVYMFLGSMGQRGKKKNKLLYFLLAIGLIFLTWYAYNYMPIFGKAYRMELSEQSVDSLETHENVSHYIIISVALLWLLGWKLRKYKTDKRCYLTIVFILGVGYLSNYIGYTTLATIFLFWDAEMGNPKCSIDKERLIRH